MCKIIASVNLNAYFVNRKANSAMKKFNKANPDLLNIDMLTKLVPRLVQLVLRVDTFKKPAGTPFYAYIKDGNPLCVVVDIQVRHRLLTPRLSLRKPMSVLSSSLTAQPTNW